MAKAAIEATARNSDCQFCRVGSRSPRGVAKPADRVVVLMNKIAMTVPNDRPYSAVRQPPTRAQAGEDGVAWRPTFWSLSD